MKFERVLGSILKKGSRIGYLDQVRVRLCLLPSVNGRLVLLAATKRRVFKNMRDARVVGWVGLEPNGKDIVAVIAGNMEMFGARFLVLKVQSCQFQLWNMLGP
jgi:hypothetical protein